MGLSRTVFRSEGRRRLKTRMKRRKCVNSGVRRQRAFLCSGSPGGCTRAGSLSSSGRAVTFRQTPLCTSPQVAPGCSPVSVCLGPPARAVKTARWGKAGGPWGRTEGPSLPGQGLVLVTVEPSSLWAERMTETLPWSRVVLEGPFRAGMALRLPTVVSVSAPCPPRPLWSPPLSCGELGDVATGEFSDTLSLREGSRVTWLF